MFSTSSGPWFYPDRVSAGPGRDDAAGIERLGRGHAVMASFRRGDGEVFNGGTTGLAHGLAAGDPFVDRITRSVLDRFLGR